MTKRRKPSQKNVIMNIREEKRYNSWLLSWYATRVHDHANIIIIAEYDIIGNNEHPKLYALANGQMWKSRNGITIASDNIDINFILKSLNIIEADKWRHKYGA